MTERPALPPEERLLRLIRGQRPPDASKVPTAVGASGPASAAGGSWWVRTPAAWWQWLPVVNRALALTTMVLLGAVALRIILWRPPAVPSAPAPSAPASSAADATTVAPAVREPAIDVGVVAQRNLFQGPPAGTAAPAAAPAVPAHELVGRLQLTGVIAGAQPQAVILDAQGDKTYFVRVGERLEGDIIVQEITEGKVVLESGGQLIELSL